MHIDNTGIGGVNEDDVRLKVTEFLSRLAQVGVAVKDANPPITTHFEFIGIEFDLERRQYRLPPAWAHRAATFITEVCDLLEDQYLLPLRILWQVLGSIFWTAHATQRALGPFWHMMQFTRRSAPRDHHHRSPLWEKPHSVPPGVIDEWRQFSTMLVENQWLHPPSVPPAMASFETLLATDSSTPAGGYCFEALPPSLSSHSAAWWQWPPKVFLHMSLPAREALACVRAAQDALPSLTTPVIWLVDCRPVLQAMKKGFSGAPVLNALILFLRNLPYPILWVWIPTALMPADTYSRKLGFSPCRVHSGSLLSFPLLQYLSQHLSKQPIPIGHCQWLIL